MQRVTQLEIHAEEGLLICADGEAITETPASIRIVPSALQVLVP
jgi:diacylglycerol kinase family enzyme